MDLSLVTGAVGALRTALDIGKAAVEIRDANKLNDVVIRMNEQLLSAQQSLFAHNAELLSLQQEHFKVTQELRELKEALAERGRYTLVEIRPGQYTYQLSPVPAVGEGCGQSSPQPDHYICQKCFDGPDKTKVVLQRRYGMGNYVYWECPSCKTRWTDKSA